MAEQENTDLFQEVKKTLEKFPKYFSDENKTLLRNAVIEDCLKLDKNLINTLFNNQKLKTRFFSDCDGFYVFDKEKFIWLVNNKEFLPDSFTAFKQKIGLVDYNNQFISTNKDVVLSFPYKDCVLEGGQTKEEQKKDEVFYNEILAPDDIDCLLNRKVFTNAKKYSRQGAELVNSFSETDNLIIKGNNLLVLSSLVPRYKGRIKLIYIDPPYYFRSNKAEDTFSYNSNFKLSSWLVFMKNRFEIARQLLTNDGAIFVQISDDGVGELHCLLKELFGAENFINKITVKTKSPSGFASVNPGVFETAEYILCFAKNKKEWNYTPQYVECGYDPNYKFVITNKNAPTEDWEIKNIVDVIATEKNYKNASIMKNELGKAAVEELVANYAFEHADSVFRYTAIGTKAGQNVVEARDNSKIEPNKVFTLERNNQYTLYIHKGQEIAFYSKKLRNIDGKLVPAMQVSNIWIDTPYEGIAKEGSVKLKGGKKPEKLIRRIIEMASNVGDIVLDYHLGSGTTCAVAHKIGRKYIGIEQLEYGENSPIVRLQSVIKGDKSGISKAVNWKGGGDFVYCELKELNQQYIDKIHNAGSDPQLVELYNEISNSKFISTKVDSKSLEENANEFAQLSIDNKRKLLLQLLDLNMLYVNYSDIDDEDFNVSEEDKKFNKNFYGE